MLDPCSELEAMRLDLLDNFWFEIIVHRLTAEVLVEEASSASECVLFVLVVVGIEVANEAAAHMRVILTGADGGEELRACLLVKVGSEGPAGGDHDDQVEPDQGDTLLGILDEG